MSHSPAPVIVKGNPNWLPPALRERPKALTARFRLSLPERNIYRKWKRIPVTDWAEKHRIVTRGPLEGTRLRPAWTPRTTAFTMRSGPGAGA